MNGAEVIAGRFAIVRPLARGNMGQVCEALDELTGDKVAVKTTFRATHQGSFAGVPASGRSVEVGGCDVFRVRDGKIVEYWSVVDVARVLQQLGALPGPPG